MEEKSLTELFGSVSRVRLLKLFLNNSAETFSILQISSKTRLPTNQVRKELNRLIKIGLIKKSKIS